MMKFNIFVVLSFALLTVLLTIVEADSVVESGDRIVGGTKARRGQFPHQVSLRRSNGNSHFCSGALVTRHSIITSAQCTQGHESRPRNVIAVVGSHLLSRGTAYHVSRIVNHPHFNSTTLANDISVIVTIKAIRFSSFVRPVQFLHTDLPDVLGLKVIITGWGQHSVSAFAPTISVSQFLKYSFSKHIAVQQ